ncbi:MAG: VOC family protein [Comamonas sp.]
MPVQAINHVQLPFPVGTGPLIRHFYGELLGLPELSVGAAGAGNGALRFVAGGQRIDLVPSTGRAAGSVSHLALEVDGLPELRQRLLDAQTAVVESSALPGYLRFFAKDPAGNQLEFLEPEQGGIFVD